MCLQYKVSAEITVCVLSNCSEGKKKPQQTHKANNPSLCLLARLLGTEAVGCQCSLLPGVSCPPQARRQRLRASQPRPQSVFIRLPQGSMQTVAVRVRASLPACGLLVSGQKLLFQLLVGGQKHAKFGDTCFL